MNRINTSFIYIFIVLCGILFYVPFTGRVHLFDWDEINFAESAREMIVSGNYLDVQINFESFWEKPPLFIWMQVVSMKAFGINEFAARFPNAICGILTLLALFRIGKKLRDEKFAILWMLAFTGSVLPFFYFKSGIIDPWFNLFIFLGVVHFFYYLSEELVRKKNLVLSAFFLGLAILTKGPVALLIFFLSFTIYLLFVKFRIRTSFVDVALYSLVLAITGGFWFILQIFNGNLGIVRDFITYQIRLFSTRDAGHGGFFLYHFVILLAGVFPASLFAIPGFRKDKDFSSKVADFHLWMLILFWVVLILFTVVKTKIVHYSSLCYFPMSWFAAVFLNRMLYSKSELHPVLKITAIIIGSAYGLIVASLPLIERFKHRIVADGLIKDPFARGNLMADVQWNNFIPVFGILFFLAIVYFFTTISKKPKYSVTGIFAATIVFAYLTIIFVTPKIEAYSQRAAIEFYKSVSGDDAYVTTLGFKSYAHLFYKKVKPGCVKLTREQLLKGDTDKPVYVVFKAGRKERYLKEYPDLIVLYEKNGFVFSKRNE